MFKRFGLMIGLLVAFLVLAVPLAVNAEEEAYTESVYFEIFSRGPNHFEQLQVRATKQVDGNWRQTVVDYYYRTCFRNQCVTTDVTGVLYEDPDGLEVSNDLGWGSLDGHIGMPDGRTMQFHVVLPASEAGYWESGDYFIRNALLEGYILIDGAMAHDFSRLIIPNYYSESAYNFSDQWPGY
jgi:hypothetical protein